MPDVPISLELHVRQGEAYTSRATEILYGGAAGGGKSHLMRVAAINFCAEIPGLNAYLFRRIEGDLFKNHIEGPHGFPMLLGPWINQKMVSITEDKIRFRFNGSVIHLCHCKDEDSRFKYLGAEIHLLLVDELTTFSEVMYRFLRSRLRAPGLNIPPQYRICSHCGCMQDVHGIAPEACDNYRGIFPRVICGTNPGGNGHLWVKRTFVNGGPWKTRKVPDEEGGLVRQFIPAKIRQPTLMTDEPEYHAPRAGLGNRELVKAMEEGDWDVVAGAFLILGTHRATSSNRLPCRSIGRGSRVRLGIAGPVLRTVVRDFRDGQPLPDGAGIRPAR